MKGLVDYVITVAINAMLGFDHRFEQVSGAINEMCKHVTV